MVLYGKTDIEAIKQAPKNYNITVHLGGKKRVNPKKPDGNLIMGEDLFDRFRIEANNPKVITRLKSLKIIDDNQHAHELNIVLDADKIEFVFPTSAKRWSRKTDELSGLLWECNLQKIYREKIPWQTPFGLKSKTVECDKPCLVNKDGICPQRCAQTGVLYFHIYELLQKGYNLRCALTIPGEFNIRNIPKQLLEIKETYGTMKHAPGSISSCNSIVYTIFRQIKDAMHPVIIDGKYTGKKTLKPTSFVTLNINPKWYEQYTAIKEAESIQRLGYAPNLKLIQQVHPQLVSSELRLLTRSPNNDNPNLSWVMTDQSYQELAAIWNQYKWNKDSLLAMLSECFQINTNEKLFDIDLVTFQTIKDYLSNQNVINKYNKPNA